MSRNPDVEALEQRAMELEEQNAHLFDENAALHLQVEDLLRPECANRCGQVADGFDGLCEPCTERVQHRKTRTDFGGHVTCRFCTRLMEVGMIKEFVERFDAKREWLKGEFSKAHPESYEDIVKLLVSALGSEDEDECPSPARVHKIDDGDYQGTLVFVIGAAGYQPSRYWFT